MAAGLVAFAVIPSLVTTEDSAAGLLLWFLVSGFLLVSGLLIGIGPVGARTYGIVTLVAVALFLVSVVAHNVVSALIGGEEAVFFFLAVFGAPVLLVTGLVGLAWTGIRRLRQP